MHITQKKFKKEYVGDGVYAEFNKYELGDCILTTSNGMMTTNTIALEPSVLNLFLTFVKENSPIKEK